VLPARIDN